MNVYDTYPEFVATEVEWLKKLPTHWSTLPISALLEERGELNKKAQVTNILSVVKDIGVIPYAEKGNIGNKKSDDIERYKLVKKGDLVINSMNVIIGSVGISKYDGALSQVYLVLKVRKGKVLNVTFLGYIFQIRAFQRWLKRLGYGILDHRLRIPMDNLKREFLPIPPIKEQQTIATFLDHETARIDILIEKQQKLIALLKEKRQAVISHAVTKGLDPTAPMKDSGVEWLGEVPEHWRQSRIGWLCKVGNGCTPKREDVRYWREGHFPWLNSSTVNDERVTGSEQFVTATALSECALPIVPDNSVIMAITGEGKTRGTAAITKFEATINQHVAYMHPISSKLDPDFLLLWLQSNYQRIRFESAGWGSTKAAITCSDIRHYQLPLPSVKEQRSIAVHIDKLKEKFDKLISKTEVQVSLLQERRTALISAAVTGKIDVRNHPSAREAA